jgi:recombination protein RecT
MSTALAQRSAQLEIQEFFTARSGELAKALPSHIRPEYFQRAVMTAIAANPKLLNVDRRSLWNASLKCAQDGLTPDGREAAFVIFRSKEGEIAQYLRMVGGIRKLVLQSGEITRFEQTIVYQHDRFNIRFGDRPHIHHEPVDLNDRGKPIAVYSVAQFRDGTLSREVMTVEEIEKVRAVSRTAHDGPWKQWWEEMARKTVARRHAKVLPMSTDVAALLAREGDEDFNDPSPPATVAVRPVAAARPRLAETLDHLASSRPGPAEANQPEPQRRPRGRPRKQLIPSDAEIEQSQARIGNVLGEPPPTDDLDQTNPRDDEPPDSPPDPREEIDQTDPPERIEDVVESVPTEPPATAHPDWQNGWRSARNGARTCLNQEIAKDPRRFRNWQAGYNAYLDQRAQT